MTKKSRLKNDPFGWVDGSTDKPEGVAQHNQSTQSKPEASAKTAKAKPTAAKTNILETAIEKQRIIFIAFNKTTGDIVATQELMLENANDSDIPWSGIPDEVNAQAFKLTGELADKALIEIHKNYKVTGSGKLELK